MASSPGTTKSSLGSLSCDSGFADPSFISTSQELKTRRVSALSVDWISEKKIAERNNQNKTTEGTFNRKDWRKFEKEAGKIGVRPMLKKEELDTTSSKAFKFLARFHPKNKDDRPIASRKQRSKSAERPKKSKSMFSSEYTKVISPNSMRKRDKWANTLRSDSILDEEYYKLPYEEINREILGRFSKSEPKLASHRRAKKTVSFTEEVQNLSKHNGTELCSPLPRDSGYFGEKLPNKTGLTNLSTSLPTEPGDIDDTFATPTIITKQNVTELENLLDLVKEQERILSDDSNQNTDSSEDESVPLQLKRKPTPHPRSHVPLTIEIDSEYTDSEETESSVNPDFPETDDSELSSSDEHGNVVTTRISENKSNATEDDSGLKLNSELKNLDSRCESNTKTDKFHESDCDAREQTLIDHEQLVSSDVLSSFNDSFSEERTEDFNYYDEPTSLDVITEIPDEEYWNNSPQNERKSYDYIVTQGLEVVPELPENFTPEPTENSFKNFETSKEENTCELLTGPIEYTNTPNVIHQNVCADEANASLNSKKLVCGATDIEVLTGCCEGAEPKHEVPVASCGSISVSDSENSPETQEPFKSTTNEINNNESHVSNEAELNENSDFVVADVSVAFGDGERIDADVNTSLKYNTFLVDSLPAVDVENQSLLLSDSFNNENTGAEEGDECSMSDGICIGDSTCQNDDLGFQTSFPNDFQNNNIAEPVGIPERTSTPEFRRQNVLIKTETHTLKDCGKPTDLDVHTNLEETSQVNLPINNQLEYGSLVEQQLLYGTEGLIESQNKNNQRFPENEIDLESDSGKSSSSSHNIEYDSAAESGSEPEDLSVNMSHDTNFDGSFNSEDSLLSRPTKDHELSKSLSQIVEYDSATESGSEKDEVADLKSQLSSPDYIYPDDKQANSKIEYDSAFSTSSTPFPEAEPDNNLTKVTSTVEIHSPTMKVRRDLYHQEVTNTTLKQDIIIPISDNLSSERPVPKKRNSTLVSSFTKPKDCIIEEPLTNESDTTDLVQQNRMKINEALLKAGINSAILDLLDTEKKKDESDFQSSMANIFMAKNHSFTDHNLILNTRTNSIKPKVTVTRIKVPLNQIQNGWFFPPTPMVTKEPDLPFVQPKQSDTTSPTPSSDGSSSGCFSATCSPTPLVGTFVREIPHATSL